MFSKHPRLQPTAEGGTVRLLRRVSEEPVAGVLLDACPRHLDGHPSAAFQGFIGWLLEMLIQKTQGALFILIEENAAELQQLAIRQGHYQSFLHPSVLSA
jgi:hypothetical protein